MEFPETFKRTFTAGVCSRGDLVTRYTSFVAARGLRSFQLIRRPSFIRLGSTSKRGFLWTLGGLVEGCVKYPRFIQDHGRAAGLRDGLEETTERGCPASALHQLAWKPERPHKRTENPRVPLDSAPERRPSHRGTLATAWPRPSSRKCRRWTAGRPYLAGQYNLRWWHPNETQPQIDPFEFGQHSRWIQTGGIQPEGLDYAVLTWANLRPNQPDKGALGPARWFSVRRSSLAHRMPRLGCHGEAHSTN